MTLVLVVGYGESSGKTVLAASLARILYQEGVDVAGVKPLAGVDLWENPWVLLEAVDRRVIASGDALRLLEASRSGESVETVSPVTVYTAPVDPSRAGWRRPHVGGLVVAGRVSACRESRVDTLHFVNAEALDRVPPGIASEVVAVAGRLRPLPLRVGDEFAERVLYGGFTAEVESCMAGVVSRHELVVMESNSDVALPTPSALGAEWVLVVSPGVVGVAEGSRWARAVELLAGSSLLGVRVEDVVRVAGVREVFHLPLLADPSQGYGPGDISHLLDYLGLTR